MGRGKNGNREANHEAVVDNYNDSAQSGERRRGEQTRDRLRRPDWQSLRPPGCGQSSKEDPRFPVRALLLAGLCLGSSSVTWARKGFRFVFCFF